MPGAGHIYLHFALSRFARILGTLLHNGIPILQSLRIAKDSTGNKVLSDAKIIAPEVAKQRASRWLSTTHGGTAMPVATIRFMCR